MLKTEGVSILVMPGCVDFKKKSFKCNHCDGTRDLVCITPRGVEEDGYHWCDVCDARVCNACKRDARNHRCIPFERRMEIMEARGMFIRDIERLTT